MKKPRERFRHLKTPPSSSEELRTEEAKQRLAEIVDNVVEVPAYRSRTEHAEPSTWGKVLLRWVAPILAGLGVLVGVVYGTVSLYARNQRIQALREKEQQRLQVLSNLRKEIISNVKLLRNQVVVLDALEESARSWQHLPPPQLETRYVSAMWKVFSADVARSEDATFVGNLDRFYNAFPTIERALRDLDRDAQNWHAWTKGITPQTLARSRDRALISRVRRLDREFADKVARLRDTLVDQRDAGEQLLEQFPVSFEERKRP